MVNRAPQNKTTFVDPAFSVPEGVIGITQDEADKTKWVDGKRVPVDFSSAGTGSGSGATPVNPNTGGPDGFADNNGWAADAAPPVETPTIIGVSEPTYVIGPSGAPVAEVILDVTDIDNARYEFRVALIAD